MAIGTILVVGVAVLGSLTFLPALLSLLGKGTDRGRIPFLGRRQAAARPSRLWGAVVRAVVRRPLALGGLATIALLVMAAPVLSLRLEDPGSTRCRRRAGGPHARAILHAFPGGPEPAEVVVTGDGLTGPRVGQAISGMHAAAAATHGAIREPITTAAFDGGRVLVVSVPLAGSGTDPASVSALGTLAPRCCPRRWGRYRGSATRSPG